MNRFFSLITLVALVSCATPASDQQESNEVAKTDDQVQDELYQEVIEVHDIAMLKMETIMNLKNEAITEADSLRDLSDSSIAGHIEELEKMQVNLEEANMAMMGWMRAFRPVADTVSHPDAMKYLESELDKIHEVNNKMDQVIEKAKAN